MMTSLTLEQGHLLVQNIWHIIDAKRETLKEASNSSHSNNRSIALGKHSLKIWSDQCARSCK